MAKYRNALNGGVRESTRKLGYPYIEVDADDQDTKPAKAKTSRKRTTRKAAANDGA